MGVHASWASPSPAFVVGVVRGNCLCLPVCTTALSAVDVTAALGGDAVCVVIVVGAQIGGVWK